MNNREIYSYRGIALSNYFVEKYNYNFVKYPGMLKNEIFLFSRENQYFNVIRITTDSTETLFFNKDNVLNIFKMIANQLNLPHKFINITVLEEKVKQIDEFYSTSLGINSYIDGYDLSKCYDGICEVIKDVSDPRIEIIKNISNLNIKNTFKKRSNLKTFPVVSLVIALISILLFVLINLQRFKTQENLIPMSIALGANYHTFVIGLGQYWRLFTAIFIHIDFFHLFFNLVSLYYLGIIFENRMGRLKYFLSFLISGFIGNCLWLIFKNNGVSFGLSSSLYGLLIMLILNYYENGILFRNNTLLFIIFINIIFNFSPNIAFMAHIGGAIGGVFCYYLFFKKEVDNKFFKSILISFILFILGICFKISTIKKVDKIYGATDIEVIRIYEKINLKDYSKDLTKRLFNYYLEVNENE